MIRDIRLGPQIEDGLLSLLANWTQGQAALGKRKKSFNTDSAEKGKENTGELYLAPKIGSDCFLFRTFSVAVLRVLRVKAFSGFWDSRAPREVPLRTQRIVR